jgi:hypothetical protein
LSESSDFVDFCFNGFLFAGFFEGICNLRKAATNVNL